MKHTIGPHTNSPHLLENRFSFPFSARLWPPTIGASASPQRLLFALRGADCAESGTDEQRPREHVTGCKRARRGTKQRRLSLLCGGHERERAVNLIDRAPILSLKERNSLAQKLNHKTCGRPASGHRESLTMAQDPISGREGRREGSRLMGDDLFQCASSHKRSESPRASRSLSLFWALFAAKLKGASFLKVRRPLLWLWNRAVEPVENWPGSRQR